MIRAHSCISVSFNQLKHLHMVPTRKPKPCEPSENLKQINKCSCRHKSSKEAWLLCYLQHMLSTEGSSHTCDDNPSQPQCKYKSSSTKKTSSERRSKIPKPAIPSPSLHIRRPQRVTKSVSRFGYDKSGSPQL